MRKAAATGTTPTGARRCCSVCQGTDHTLSKCPDERAVAIRLKNAEAATTAKKAAHEQLRQSLHITRGSAETAPPSLPNPVIQPGRAKPAIAERCQTLRGAIDACLPAEFIDQVLAAMNANLELDSLERADKQLQNKYDKPYKMRRVDVAPTASRKGRVGFAQTAMVPTENKREQVRSSRRKTTLTCINWQAITKDEFYRFLAILLYAANNKTDRWSSYWKTDQTESTHRFVSTTWPRDRFKLIHASFRFTDEQLLHMEPILQAHLNAIWQPATAVVVDECMVPFKGKSQHHV